MRSSMCRVLMLCSAMLASALPGGAGAAARTVVLRYHFHQGQRVALTSRLAVAGVVNIGGTVQPVNATIRSPYVLTVQHAAIDGAATLRFGFGAVEVKLNGTVTSSPVGGYAIETLSSLGASSGIKTYNMPSSSLFGSSINTNASLFPALPTHAVAVGGSWTSAQHIAMGTLGSASGVVRYTLASIGTLHGRPLALVRDTSAIPVSVTVQGLTLHGVGLLNETTRLFTDWTEVLDVHGTVSMKGTMSGSVQGRPVQGTFAELESLDITRGS